MAQNRNSRIRQRITRNFRRRTETVNRDADSIRVAASTTSSDNTNVYIDFPSEDGDKLYVVLSGAEARTVYNVLRKHYMMLNKSY